MRQTLKTGDDLVIKICETACSEKIPPVYHPLDIVYEDEDIVVINKAAGMPIHPSLNHYTDRWQMRLHGTIRNRENLLFSVVATA